MEKLSIGGIDQLIAELETTFGADMELSASGYPATGSPRCTNNCTDGPNCHTE